MIRRLLRKAFVLAIIAAVIGAVIVAARKLLGGVGPDPGSGAAPREWPSLVPDPVATTTPTGGEPSGNGASSPSENAEL